MSSFKSKNRWKRMEKNNFAIRSFFAKKILNHFSLIASDFEPKIQKRVRFGVNLFQLVIFWINFCTTCPTFNQPFYYPSDLNRIFYNTSDFEVKLFPEKPILLSFIRKDHFFVSFNHGNVKIEIFVLSGKFLFSERCFDENSNLESNFPRRIRFWFIFFTKRPILNWELWNMSDFVPFF